MELKKGYQWKILRTRQGAEQKVSRILTQEKIENFCSEKKNILVSLSSLDVAFSLLLHSHVFVYVDDNQLKKVKKIKGVLSYMYWLDKLAIISNEDIHLIKKILNMDISLRIHQTKIDILATTEGSESSRNEDNIGCLNSIKLISINSASLEYLLIGATDKIR